MAKCQKIFCCLILFILWLSKECSLNVNFFLTFKICSHYLNNKYNINHYCLSLMMF